jgi:hypothetical protein
MTAPPISRRHFLGNAGLALGMGSALGLGSFAARAVTRPTGRYDVIIVGGGTAGAIVAARLQAASQGRKRILIIEAGGPTAAAIGGADVPPWLPRGRRGPTIFDVPGEYSQIAHMPLGAPYQLTETAFTFQGIGLGGNSMFNGMLFQTNPKEVFDDAWPKGWQWNDLLPHFDRVRQRIPVTNTPSPDGIAYNTGPARIAHPLYAAAGWSAANTSLPFRPPGIYSRLTSRRREGGARGRSAGISGSSTGVASRHRASRSCFSARPTGSNSIRPERRGRCTIKCATASTSRCRRHPAWRGCAPAGCWCWPRERWPRRASCC